MLTIVGIYAPRPGWRDGFLETPPDLLAHYAPLPHHTQPVSPAAIPTLGHWALVVLSALVGGLAWRRKTGATA